MPPKLILKHIETGKIYTHYKSDTEDISFLTEAFYELNKKEEGYSRERINLQILQGDSQNNPRGRKIQSQMF